MKHDYSTEQFQAFRGMAHFCAFRKSAAFSEHRNRFEDASNIGIFNSQQRRMQGGVPHRSYLRVWFLTWPYRSHSEQSEESLTLP